MATTLALPASSIAPELQLLTANQLWKILGIGSATGWRWKAMGKLPTPIDFGGANAGRTTLRWRAAEIEAWINSGCPDNATWEAQRRATG